MYVNKKLIKFNSKIFKYQLNLDLKFLIDFKK